MQTNASMQRKSTDIQDWPLVAWWIRITSPVPGSPASLRNPQWREEVTSLLCFLVILESLLPMSTAIEQLPDPRILITLLTTLSLKVGAVFLKRAGKMEIAGVLILAATQLSQFYAMFAPGYLTISSLDLLSLLVLSIVITMAFFRPVIILWICMLNCCYIFGVLEFFPHTAALNQQFTQNFASTLTTPIQLQITVALASFILIRALLKEIRRADNAEELAQLKQSEAELRKREAQQAQQLEEGIQLILQSLNTAATKGDFSMRVPLAQENILWRVGYSINNLLARLQGFRHEKAELEKTRAVATQLTECIRQGQYFPMNQWTGTSLDQLIIEINKQLNISARSSDQPLPHTTSHHYQ
jgi:hypothetical protein